MEANQTKKFVCKFCNRRFPCGKSLGGHIRTHMTDNSASVDAEDEDKPFTSMIFTTSNGRYSNCKRDSGHEVGGQSTGYGLRENPKKTKRFVDSSNTTTSLQAKVCRECGKGFQSLKALCGHMACHSEKEKLRNGVADQSGTSHSDTETSAPSRPRRSDRTRHKTPPVYSSPSVSEIEQEQEELAKCLMMLSRDCGNRGRVNSVVESSDTNSVVLETKSSSIDMRITKRDCMTDFGCFRNVLNKRVESDVYDDYNKHKKGFGSGIGNSGAELGKRVSKIKREKTEFQNDFVEDEGYDQVDRAKDDSPEFHCDNAQKKGKYQCLTCYKIFPTHRALGGHRASHYKKNPCSDSTCESGENSIDTDYSPDPPLPIIKITESCSAKTPVERAVSGIVDKKSLSKNSKKRECPICFKVFSSGQALGGHKRSHFLGSGEDRRTVVIQQNLSKVPGLIDLNLPAPVDDEPNGSM